MDIVTRLKYFLNHESVAITQFADNCKIPRPTLSQLLNGRNKKVSDELISKIHDAYPKLSILWLMFGEGKMINDKAPNNTQNTFAQQTDNPLIAEQAIPQINFESDLSEITTNTQKNSENSPFSGIKSSPLELTSSGEIPNGENSNPFNPFTKKRIVNIIVYYDDNSFESFTPGIAK